ncbi:MAG: hypothetical protein Q9214_001144 [Letrouitia sp. 1 TL-2023]
MAPSATVDLDLKNASSNDLPRRTLILSPPSLSAHPERLNKIIAAHERNATDIQMLDRLSLSVVALPDSTYELVLILNDADDTRSESQKLLTKHVLSRIINSMRPNARLRSQDGEFAAQDSEERREAIFAGLIVENGDMVKPGYVSTQPVPLSFGARKSNAAAGGISTDGAANGAVPLEFGVKRKNGSTDAVAQPAGVGFVDFSDDFGAPAEDRDEDEDELIDEDTLLDDEDLKGPLIQPPECRPKTGKRRRACKDCTCGLAQRLEAEDAARRNAADQKLAKLKADELTEVDFTVKGKVGSCGNCALGDAFRCDGCPYIGLPAFKPGEEVRLMNNEVQL